MNWLRKICLEVTYRKTYTYLILIMFFPILTSFLYIVLNTNFFLIFTDYNVGCPLVQIWVYFAYTLINIDTRIATDRLKGKVFIRKQWEHAEPHEIMLKQYIIPTLKFLKRCELIKSKVCSFFCLKGAFPQR